MEIRFKLNPKNEKDKVIIDLLGGEYNSTDFIKSLLYKVATGGSKGIPLLFNGGINSVNISNDFPTTPQSNTLVDDIGIEKTSSNEDIEIQSDDDRNIENEFGDFFN